MATRESLTSTSKTARLLPNIFMAAFTLRMQTAPVGADFPGVTGRVGMSYADREYIQTAVRERRSVVGRAVLGKTLKQPIIPIATRS